MCVLLALITAEGGAAGPPEITFDGAVFEKTRSCRRESATKPWQFIARQKAEVSPPDLTLEQYRSLVVAAFKQKEIADGFPGFLLDDNGWASMVKTAGFRSEAVKAQIDGG